MNNSRPPDYWLLWFVALTSLAMNVWLLTALSEARSRVAEAAAQAAQAVGRVRAASITHRVPVNHTLPLSATLPVSTTVRVPISVTLPINTRVTVAVPTPFGEIPINIPVRTTVPVDVQPTVPIRTSVPISLVVPLALDVPIDLRVADTALGQSLAEVEAYLNELAADWGAVSESPTPASDP